MKRIVIATLLTAVSMAGPYSSAPVFPADKTPPPAQTSKAPGAEKAAVINQTVITKAEYDKELARVLKRFEREGKEVGEEDKKAIGKDVLDNLIERELLVQESAAKGIAVDDATVQQRLSDVKKNFPDDGAFQKALGEMDTTEKEITDTIRQSLIIQNLIDTAIAARVAVSEEERKSFYDTHPDLFKSPDQIQASHILIKSDPFDAEEAKTKARDQMREVQKKLKEGGDFAALAKEFSACPSSANGGDLGFFSKGQMVQPFEEAAFALKPGEVSDIVVTQFGYHLIKVTNTKPASTVAYDEAKEKIGAHLKNEKTKAEVTQYIEGLKSKAAIQVF